MTHRYFKAIIYNNSCQWDEAFYVDENKTTGYRQVVDEEGKTPSLFGDKTWCNELSKVLSLEDTTNIIPNIVECSWADLPEEVKNAFYVSCWTAKETKTTEQKNEPDWKTLRIQMAENFMANMLNADETFKTKIVSDLLYKELAAFSVKCADALIEELKK